MNTLDDEATQSVIGSVKPSPKKKRFSPEKAYYLKDSDKLKEGNQRSLQDL